MAKVVGPLHSSEARGSVGSLTYNTWRGISIVKARAGPTTQYSDDQVALRALTALATASWQSITDAQRDAWRQYASEHLDSDWTGNPKRLTGYNWYVRINVRRQLISLAIEVLPPTEPVTYSITGLRYTNPIDDLHIRWDVLPWEPQGEQYIEFYIVGPHSPGRHPNIQQADRKGHATELTGSYYYHFPPTGTYTLFARPLSNQGLVGGFQRLLMVAR